MFRIIASHGLGRFIDRQKIIELSAYRSKVLQPLAHISGPGPRTRAWFVGCPPALAGKALRSSF
jgi:hypothetical protein